MEEKEKKGFQFWPTLFFLALLVVLVVFVSKISVVIGYFATAGALAYILNPAVEAMCRRRIPRGLAILIIFIVFIGIITIAVVFIVPPAVKQFNDLVHNLPGYFETIKELWGKVVSLSKTTSLPMKLENLPEKVAGDMQKMAGNVAGTIFSSIAGFLSGLAALVIVPILAYYFLKDGHKMYTAFLSCIPPTRRDETKLLAGRINLALGGFLRGQLKLCLAMGVLTWLSLAIVAKMKYALVFGVIAGVTEFIPYLGPILALIGPLIYATTISGKVVVTVIALFLVMQVLEAYVLAPRIMGQNVNMHPMMIILILMAGGQVAGIPGMIVAIPVAVVIKVLFEYFYIEKIVKAGGLEK